MTVLPLPESVPGRDSRAMNTFLSYLSIAVLFTLVLLPALVGAARERRIDRRLREAERGHAGPPGTADAARPVTATRRPYAGSWART
ncbi:hypothetical protein K373_03093 [Streptomyces sp. DvalAA-21]|nr:hypothetical protein SACTE_4461 [Streptomyces sp. SirexAA-E]PZX38641.1 hypothetical protein K373_03093 [Streptomyces sp. DvalAA-21]RAJ34974.1 hypothetical protein K351_02838 [Streptomyces sp. DpondAA-E10]RAJ49220.1 hypothetical protein K352_02212 [Streptomyces sp. DpondAA-A50]SCD29134.1 hypothetical protein GA0115239_100349 [Streptomyces sp. BpilaLS-43]SCD52099.1 hypothetical protein GA0115235_103450 [Streptomyces sp. DpondAA-F4a]SCM14756.1 hypothetical protein SAMN04883147_112849 [Strepto